MTGDSVNTTSGLDMDEQVSSVKLVSSYGVQGWLSEKNTRHMLADIPASTRRG